MQEVKTYYPNGNIREIYYVDDMGKKCGEYKEFYDNGKKQSEKTYKMGFLNGPYVTFHYDGKKCRESIYVDGKLHGEELVWNKKGEKIQENNWKNGVLHGTSRTWYYGNLFYECNYDDMQNRCEKEFYFNGNVKSEIYFNRKGNQYTELYRYRTNGTKFFECKYNENSTIKSSLWYENGKKQLECEMKDKKILGDYNIWNINGELILHARYEDISAKLLVAKDEKGRDCILPPGKIIVWKVCKTTISPFVYVIVKLEVAENVKRITAFDDFKLEYVGRVEKAKVLEIKDLYGNNHQKAVNCVYHGKRLLYEVGEVVESDSFDDDCANYCSYGINVVAYRDDCYRFLPTVVSL